MESNERHARIVAALAGGHSGLTTALVVTRDPEAEAAQEEASHAPYERPRRRAKHRPDGRAYGTPTKPTAFRARSAQRVTPEGRFEPFEVEAGKHSLAALPEGCAAGAARPRGKRHRSRFDDVAAYARAVSRLNAESPARQRAMLHREVHKLRSEMRAEGRPRREVRAACAALVREYNT